jgi:hypothetical protein
MAPIDMLDVSADGGLLLTGDRGGTIRLWPLFTTAALLKTSEAGQKN